MSYDTQTKQNLLSIFLPTFLAVLFAVPMAAVMTFAILHANPANAESTNNATTAITNPGVACVAPSVPVDPATTTVPAGNGSGVGYFVPAQTTGNISQVSYETITTTTTTYNDSFNTGSYNDSHNRTSTDSHNRTDSHDRTITRSDSHNNTQSFTDDHSNTGSFNADNSNQGNPVTTTNTVNAPTTTTTTTTTNISDNGNTLNSGNSATDSHDVTTTDSHDATLVTDNGNSVSDSHNVDVDTTTVGIVVL